MWLAWVILAGGVLCGALAVRANNRGEYGSAEVHTWVAVSFIATAVVVAALWGHIERLLELLR